MRDFYSMTAFFRNNTLRALDDSRGRDYPPTILFPSPADRMRWPELQQSLTAKTNEINSRQAAARPISKDGSRGPNLSDGGRHFSPD
jgi:hypothetical protein